MYNIFKVHLFCTLLGNNLLSKGARITSCNNFTPFKHTTVPHPPCDVCLPGFTWVLLRCCSKEQWRLETYTYIQYNSTPYILGQPDALIKKWSHSLSWLSKYVSL